jgi:hypothetical protein
VTGFLNLVNAQQAKKQITKAQAESFTKEAEEIQAALGCSTKRHTEHQHGRPAPPGGPSGFSDHAPRAQTSIHPQARHR